ncbi:MAG TPA: hypothetical protein PKD79_03165 [Candidatus Doudnabacteria bacterium]|nr:hypothetical protein [Candidatus Doudnabacteria bacterium]
MNPFYHKFVSAFFGIGFVAMLHFLTVSGPVFRYLLGGLALYLTILTLYNWRYLLSQQAYTLWLLLRVPLFVFVWFGLLLIVPFGPVRTFLLLVGLILIFVFETLIANKGQQLGWNIFLISLAGLFLGLYGFHFYFPLSGLLYLGLIFLGTTMLVRVSVEAVPHSNQVKWFAALVLGLFAAQLFWITQFLPLHFSVLAIISFNVLYLLWTIYYHYLYQSLSRRQIQFHLLLVLILSGLILISTPWTIQG